MQETGGQQRKQNFVTCGTSTGCEVLLHPHQEAENDVLYTVYFRRDKDSSNLFY
jgi:hypothetical protein